jgi:hypothetical protein
MNNDEALLAEIDLMDKEILYLNGLKLRRAKNRYIRLLRSCGKNYSLENSINIDQF